MMTDQKKKNPSCCITKASETLQLNWAPKQVIFRKQLLNSFLEGGSDAVGKSGKFSLKMFRYPRT